MDDGSTRAASIGWQLYVLRCGDGTLYTGVSVDLVRRLRAHNAGRGARYTRGRLPLDLIACWRYDDAPAALRAEFRFKRLRRSRKLAAVASGTAP